MPPTAPQLTLVQLPQMSGYGYYSYSSADRQYATPDTIRTILDVCGQWKYNNPRVQIGIGDMSFVHGGAMNPHASHQKGTNIDVRPLRTDGLHSPVTIMDAKYDRESTRLIIAAFRAHRNVKSILFNDTQIHGVTSYPGHHNHFHIQTWK